MCKDKSFFSELRMLKDVQEVSLGDGHVLEATAEGTVPLEMLLPDGSKQKCSLKNVLLIPKLAYNLLSISRSTKAGKTFEFRETSSMRVGRASPLLPKWGVCTICSLAEVSNS